MHFLIKSNLEMHLEEMKPDSEHMEEVGEVVWAGGSRGSAQSEVCTEN